MLCLPEGISISSASVHLAETPSRKKKATDMQEALGEPQENGNEDHLKKERATEQVVNAPTDFQSIIRARSEMGPYS